MSLLRLCQARRLLQHCWLTLLVAYKSTLIEQTGASYKSYLNGSRPTVRCATRTFELPAWIESLSKREAKLEKLVTM